MVAPGPCRAGGWMSGVVCFWQYVACSNVVCMCIVLAGCGVIEKVGGGGIPEARRKVQSYSRFQYRRRPYVFIRPVHYPDSGGTRQGPGYASPEGEVTCDVLVETRLATG